MGVASWLTVQILHDTILYSPGNRNTQRWELQEMIVQQSGRFLSLWRINLDFFFFKFWHYLREIIINSEWKTNDLRFKSYNKFLDFLRHKKLCLWDDVIFEWKWKAGFGRKRRQTKNPPSSRGESPREEESCYPSLVTTVSEQLLTPEETAPLLLNSGREPFPKERKGAAPVT